MLKKNILQRARDNKFVHWFLICAYIIVIFTVFINLINWEIPIFNVTYSTVHTPTDHYFLQTYPPSIDGIHVGNANETIIFQVHIHADTMIMENTHVNIDAEAGVGNIFADNVSSLAIGFFGANWIPSEQTILIPKDSPNRYELWTGWAGERLYEGVKPETALLLIPEGGVEFGGSSANIFWSEAGNKPISIVFNWVDTGVFSSHYTYPYSSIRVNAYSDLRARQIADTRLIATFGLVFFGVFEVYPRIVDKKNR